MDSDKTLEGCDYADDFASTVSPDKGHQSDRLNRKEKQGIKSTTRKPKLCSFKLETENQQQLKGKNWKKWSNSNIYGVL